MSTNRDDEFGMIPTITMTPNVTLSKKATEALHRATKTNAREAFLEHGAKANEHALMAAQVYHHQEATEEANYWMLNAIFETMTAIAVLLQAEHDV